MLHIDNEIKNAWIRQLKEDWKNANFSNFRDRMILSDIDLLDSDKVLGKWEGGVKRKISISAFLIKNRPWQYVQEVLYHEMAHQYVEEVMKITDALPHGYAFKKVCDGNGIDHSAGGNIQDWVERRNNSSIYSHNHKILDKIRKLMSLAQSNNRHEAELAMAKAQEFLLKHNLSLLELERNRNYVHKQIGDVGRGNPIKSLISTIINKFFFVEALWIHGYDQYRDKKGKILEIYGTPENVEMAEYVHDYLHTISEKLWNDYKQRQTNATGNKHRRSYIYGLLNGFYKKLESKNAENETKSLIWKGDPQLKAFYRRRNPRIRQSTFHYSKSSQDAYDSGVKSGKKLVIQKGIKGQHSGNTNLLG